MDDVYFGAATFQLHDVNDWCHICGIRRDFCVDVYYPENAEHDQELTKCIRICGPCISRMKEMFDA